jgi:uncharacterized protein
LSQVILFGERSLRRALREYVEHYHVERNHQGKGNVLLFPRDADIRRVGSVQCRERLGGLLHYYYREAGVIRRQGFAMKWDLPIRPIEFGPLTEVEIGELDTFLLAEDGLENPMDFYTFDGFICAVLSGPTTIMPSEWLRWVWDQERGEQPPEFTSEKQAKRILSLLIGHANVLAFTLTHGPQHYEPLFYSHKIEGNGVPIVDEWCCGYVKGIALDPVGWHPLIEARPDWFEVIHLYGTKSGWERLKELVDAHEDSVARHQAFVDRIAPAARNIHAYWLARRAPQERLHQLRKAADPGRNDLCPCGSGKKFKRCHGAPATLH